MIFDYYLNYNFKTRHGKPPNSAPGILTETHETPFSRPIQRRSKRNMRRIKKFTYCPDSTLSNKYLKVIIQCLERKIFNEKVQVLFFKIKKSNITSVFLLNILGSIYCMMTSKCLFNRAKSEL